MLEITSALVLESTTDRIWLCDRMSGDIISCNVTSLGDIMCRVEVNHSELTFGSGNDVGKIIENNFGACLIMHKNVANYHKHN